MASRARLASAKPAAGSATSLAASRSATSGTSSALQRRNGRGGDAERPLPSQYDAISLVETALLTLPCAELARLPRHTVEALMAAAAERCHLHQRTWASKIKHASPPPRSLKVWPHASGGGGGGGGPGPKAGPKLGGPRENLHRRESSLLGGGWKVTAGGPTERLSRPMSAPSLPAASAASTCSLGSKIFGAQILIYGAEAATDEQMIKRLAAKHTAERQALPSAVARRRACLSASSPPPIHLAVCTALAT